MIEALINVFDRGGFVMILIAILAVGGSFLIVDRLFYFRKIRREVEKFFATQYPDAIKGKLPENLPDSPIVNILITGLIHIKRPVEEVEALMHETALGELPKMERHLAIIGVTGAILPMLGLLGTVVGMISTFDVIATQGTGDPRAMAGGISQALITTEAGLLTAIPFIFMHTYLTNSYYALVGVMEKEMTRILTLVRGRAGE